MSNLPMTWPIVNQSWNGDFHECHNCHQRCAPELDGAWVHDRTGRAECDADDVLAVMEEDRDPWR